jgi:hypothetical protein
MAIEIGVFEDASRFLPMQIEVMLVVRHSAARDSSEARRALWDSAGVTVADHVAIAAPLSGDLRAFVDVGADSMRGDDRKHQQRQYRD